MAPARKTHILRWIIILVQCSNPQYADEIHSIQLENGKDQFSSTDAPGPTLSVASNRMGKLAVHSSVKASFCSPAYNFLSNAVPQNVDCKVNECIVLTFLFCFCFYWFKLCIHGFLVTADQIYSSLNIEKICLKKQAH